MFSHVFLMENRFPFRGKTIHWINFVSAQLLDTPKSCVSRMGRTAFSRYLDVLEMSIQFR